MKNENESKTVVKALSAASKTPFKTAFKVTLGVMAAQTLATIAGIITLGGFAILVAYIGNKFLQH